MAKTLDGVIDEVIQKSRRAEDKEDFFPDTIKGAVVHLARRVVALEKELEGLSESTSELMKELGKLAKQLEENDERQ